MPGLHAWSKHRHVGNAATVPESVWRYISQARLVVDVDYWNVFVTEKYIVLQRHKDKLQKAYALSYVTLLDAINDLYVGLFNLWQ